jgi:transcriptional regulator with XRE-family HTH domain
MYYPGTGEGTLMTIGARIKRQRRLRRFTQAELAARAGVRQAHISLLEADQRCSPRADVIVRLAKALDCSTDYLLGMYEDEKVARVP